ncbi:MAG TPA: UDP-N-acetylenolpyruvoylglucosamine reductase [Clostridiales bacterium]|nr:UDP-N-acetylenolpyruvoylglucosamine reductase [Clostridiales bacterium]
MKRYDWLGPELARNVRLSRVRVNEPMAAHTSFGIGGPADLLAEPASGEELSAILAFARRGAVPYVTIGLGTNILVRDGGFRGLVIKMTGFRELTALCSEGSEGRLRAGAGLPLHAVADYAANLGLAGLEFAGGIPGTLGGAVVMNAGAYGGEMSQVVEDCVVVAGDGASCRLARPELGFGYRVSAIRQDQIVVEAVLRLNSASPEAILQRMADYRQRRERSQPLAARSAGSVFRRPHGHYAGALIEGAGLKGRRVGDAEVSSQHAGFIINRGEATAADVLALMESVREAVRGASGVELEPEIRIIGDDVLQ